MTFGPGGNHPRFPLVQAGVMFVVPRGIGRIGLHTMLGVALILCAGCGQPSGGAAGPATSIPTSTMPPKEAVAESVTPKWAPAEPLAPDSLEADVDTTTAPTAREGYESSVATGRWLLIERRQQSLVVLVAEGGCSKFNGYRLHQESTAVRLDVFNTVLTPRPTEPGGTRYACTTEFRGSKQEVPLPHPLGDAEVVGGCADEQSTDEDKTCQMLRRLAQHLR